LSILLSLLPPSCIVAFIRKLGNIILSTTVTHSITNDMTPIQDNDMAVDPFNNFSDIGDKFDEVRDCLLCYSMRVWTDFG